MLIDENSPSLWRDKLPRHDRKGHKYDRGVAVIYGAPKMTGATRLAARACARVGAGLVKVIAPTGTGDIYRATLHEEIIVEDDDSALSDPRCHAVLMGSGWTIGDAARHINAMQTVMMGSKAIILDAGAISVLGDLSLPYSSLVITPHDGEFAKAFPAFTGDKSERASRAAVVTGGMVVLKGAQTIIAGHGDVIAQNRDVPELSTAGTGDVLAGMITGLLAQGMETKWACAASVWIHAEAAVRFGRGMVASDLPEMIPAVLKDLV